MSAARGRRTPDIASRVVVCAAVVGALAAGCVEKHVVDFSETPRDYVAKDYEHVYKRWTRHQKVLQWPDVALEVWATFKSWDFREAYIERYAEIYSLSDTDEKTLRVSQQDVFHTAYEFHVTAQSTNYKWNDLEKSSSPWRATLIDALGHELAPEYIKVVKLPEAYEQAFFPAKTPFTRTYAIRFAVPAGGTEFAGTKSGAITLRFASPIGRVELEWRGS
jgi:hypothetical protein